MKSIDIQKLLREKKPGLARWIPPGVVRRIERLVCLPQINHVLGTHGDEAPLDFVRSTLRHIGVSYTLHGAEHIPSGGRAIFAANHPLGGLDGMALAAALAPRVPQVKLVVNDILMALQPLRPIFAPVNKFGVQNPDYARQIQAMYASRAAVITFPAGLCSRLVGGRVTDLPWHPNFVRKALESNRPVVPVYVSARNSRFFYRLARLRKGLGLKLNIEMLWLPKEMFGQTQKQIDLYLGEPIWITPERSVHEWADLVRRAVYRMQPTTQEKARGKQK